MDINEAIEKLKQLHKEGLPKIQMARDLGVSARSIGRWFDKVHIPYPFLHKKIIRYVKSKE